MSELGGRELGQVSVVVSSLSTGDRASCGEGEDTAAWAWQHSASAPLSPQEEDSSVLPMLSTGSTGQVFQKQWLAKTIEALTHF